MKATRTILFIHLVFILLACSDDTTPIDDRDSSIGFDLRKFNLSFDRPVYMTTPSEGSSDIYIVEQSGKILRLAGDQTNTTAEDFMDISDRVNSSGNEQGLLGLAFHPDYPAQAKLYVNYTGASGQTVISEFDIISNNSVDTDNEIILLEIDQPFQNHNGGMIAFGPDDNLYIATGDGGSAGDPQNNAQNRLNLLGKILRIDVINNSSGNYAIPSDNPFAGNNDGFREEIYAYGLRNPWRFSFDSQTGALWLADVGQNQLEEINEIQPGANYGWKVMEGTSCFQSETCDQENLELPVAEYGRDLGTSVTGGYVYRGTLFPQYQGHYFYGDFATGRIWTLDVTVRNPEPVLFDDTGYNISSFAIDGQNELYILDFSTGGVFMLSEASL